MISRCSPSISGTLVTFCTGTRLWHRLACETSMNVRKQLFLQK